MASIARYHVFGPQMLNILKIIKCLDTAVISRITYVFEQNGNSQNINMSISSVLDMQIGNYFNSHVTSILNLN